MPYYLRDMRRAGYPDEVWYVDDDMAFDVSQPDPQHGLARYFKADPGKTAWQKMAEQTPWFDSGDPFHELQHPEGIHYPRIARPLARARWEDSKATFSPSLHLEPEVSAASRGQARSLLRQLERICQTVEPGEATFEVYGHEIRNLLLLACMEVETHWRGVLTANGARKEVFTTRDYVALADILRLRDYAIRFPAFPALDPVRPFAHWGLGTKPTADLPWYAAYNAVKHNREEEFVQATLRYAFHALSACAVMLRAQYGEQGLGHRTDLSNFFHVVEAPSWERTDCYYYGYVEGAPSLTHLRLKALNHPVLAAIQDRPKASPTSAQPGAQQHLLGGP